MMREKGREEMRLRVLEGGRQPSGFVPMRSADSHLFVIDDQDCLG
jgi:hypothetical protein